MNSIYQRNFRELSISIQNRLNLLNESELKSYHLENSKNGFPILMVDNHSLHSKQDPIKEAKRFSVELPHDGTERVYIYLGAGLGYIVQEALGLDMISCVWLEYDPVVIYFALQLHDYSDHLISGKLQILLHPISEDTFYETFRGKSTAPVSLVPHRASFTRMEKEYTYLKRQCEKFFHKKDVNLATLVRFEKIWTKNMILNLLAIQKLHPVSKLFGIAKNCNILVVCAGPSLTDSLSDIRKYREQFLIISVDTALGVLESAGIESDLIYSVDPQSLNSYYLEGYTGNGRLVFDPTSTYLTPRLSVGPKKGFFTSSPFPLIRILDPITKENIGEIPYGGSVSTNAVSLARLMEPNNIYITGQDLSFTYKLAHAKGAVLEERLNLKESRKVRREKQNQYQLTALPKFWEESLTGGKSHTNEKLIIFRNWFQENAKDIINLTNTGLRIEGLTESSFEKSFLHHNNSEIEFIHKEVKDKINSISDQDPTWFDKNELTGILQNLQKELKEYLPWVEKGLNISNLIYTNIESRSENPEYLSKKIQEMDHIDEIVSSRKNLSEILSTSLQRVIFSVTEGYESNLSMEEKENERLSIAKKSILLYEGLLSAVQNVKFHISRLLYQMESN